MPRNRFVGLSRRVTGEEDRARAQALGRRIADGRFGLIVRHAALFAPVAEVEAEAEALWQMWRETEERARYCKAPALLHEEPPMLSVLLRDYAARHPIEVLSRLEPPEALPQGVTWQTLTAVEMEAAWSAARVEKQVDEALCRRVPLPGGGSLIIDEREALTTIDVNSGSTVTAADGERWPWRKTCAPPPRRPGRSGFATSAASCSLILSTCTATWTARACAPPWRRPRRMTG